MELTTHSWTRSDSEVNYKWLPEVENDPESGAIQAVSDSGQLVEFIPGYQPKSLMLGTVEEARSYVENLNLEGLTESVESIAIPESTTDSSDPSVNEGSPNN